MELKILAFGIAKDIIGGSSIQLPVEEGLTVASLKKELQKKYPAFEELNSVAIAINNEYAEEEDLITINDEVVIIPPVSGG